MLFRSSKDYYKNPKGEDWIGGWTSYDWNIVEGWESDMWIIGMLSDVRMSDDMLMIELEKVKMNFPEFVEMLTM